MLKKVTLILLCTFFCLAIAQNVYSQAENPSDENKIQDNLKTEPEISFFSPGGLSEEINPFWTPEETTFKTVFRYSVLIGVPVGHLIYGRIVWKWGEQTDWRWADERWFQADTDSGGADKVGHCFAHYMVSRISYSLFSYTEQSRSRALFFSAFNAALVGTMIEIGDAYTGKYGFSYEDLIADYVGIAVACLLDRYRVLDEFIGFTEYYSPSENYEGKKNRGYVNFAGDYSGAKWLLDFKLAGFKYLGFDIPEFMRYIQLDVGFYTRGYTNYDVQYNPKQYLFFGISVNMREVAKDCFTSSKKASWLAEQPFKYFHVPIGYEKNKTINDEDEE